MVDALIRIFSSTATEFTTLGLGVLSDALSCEVVEERNGEFELTLKYPISGINYSKIALRQIIVARPNPYDNPQAFRIYDISTPINGQVTVSAQHISYDLSGYIVSPFKSTNAQSAFTNLASKAYPSCPFTFSTDKTTSAEMEFFIPTSLRSLLGGMEGSILDMYGPADYEFDNYSVKFWASRGLDRGVVIRYGKNMSDFLRDEENTSVYTHIYPYYYTEEAGLITLDEKTIKVKGTFSYTRIRTLDLTDKFEEVPTKAALKTAAEKFLSENNIGIPNVSLKVSFVQLAQSEEYRTMALLETVRLCDTVTIEFTKMGVSATAKCIKTTYNVLTGRYISLELGMAKTKLSDTINNQSKEIEKNTAKSTVIRNAIDTATKTIVGGLGGYVMLRSSSGGKKPDEILILVDSDNIDTATKLWRFNSGGLGYSSNGYNGPFGLALTADGQIVADAITTGTMSADRIRGGTLILGGNTSSGSYGNGMMQLYNSNNYMSFLLNQNGIYNYSNANSDVEMLMRINETTITGYQRAYGASSWTTIGYFNLNDRFGFEGSPVNALRMRTTTVDHPIFIEAEKDVVYILSGTAIMNQCQNFQIWPSTGGATISGYPMVVSWPRTWPDHTSIETIYYGNNSIAFVEYGGTVRYVNVASSSDERLKKNIRQSKVNALDALNKIDYYEFTFTEDNLHKNVGYMAQQLEKVIPSAVYELPQRIDKKGNASIYTKKINYEELVIYATKALKELYERVLQLEERR